MVLDGKAYEGLKRRGDATVSCVLRGHISGVVLYAGVV